MLSADWIWLISGLFLAGLSVYLFVSALIGRTGDSQAFAWATGGEQQKFKSPLLNYSVQLVHNFTIQHAVRIKFQGYRKRVEQKLLVSGISQQLSVDEFIGLQILWGVMLPLLLTVMNFSLQIGLSYYLPPVLGLMGAYFPHLYCNQLRSSRYIAVIVDLPFFIDLLALSTEAGMEFMNAIQRIVEKSDDSVLAQELQVVLRDVKLGSSRTDALRALARRLDIPEVTSFISVVVDSMGTGAGISKVLKEQSAQMRLERFVRAEKAGARASQMLLLPMIIFILPAVLVVVLAPFLIQLFTKG